LWSPTTGRITPWHLKELRQEERRVEEASAAKEEGHEEMEEWSRGLLALAACQNDF
jgi:hypothetical protein